VVYSAYCRERDLRDGDPGKVRLFFYETDDIASEGLRMTLKEKLLGGTDVRALGSNWKFVHRKAISGRYLK
jgi:hypothetical protein